MKKVDWGTKYRRMRKTLQIKDKAVVPVLDLETLSWKGRYFPRYAERWEWDMISWDGLQKIEVPLLFAAFLDEDDKIMVPTVQVEYSPTWTKRIRHFGEFGFSSYREATYKEVVDIKSMLPGAGLDFRRKKLILLEDTDENRLRVHIYSQVFPLRQSYIGRDGKFGVVPKSWWDDAYTFLFESSEDSRGFKRLKAGQYEVSQEIWQALKNHHLCELGTKFSIDRGEYTRTAYITLLPENHIVVEWSGNPLLYEMDSVFS